MRTLKTERSYSRPCSKRWNCDQRWLKMRTLSIRDGGKGQQAIPLFSITQNRIERGRRALDYASAARDHCILLADLPTSTLIPRTGDTRWSKNCEMEPTAVYYPALRWWKPQDFRRVQIMVTWMGILPGGCGYVSVRVLCRQRTRSAKYSPDDTPTSIIIFGWT